MINIENIWVDRIKSIEIRSTDWVTPVHILLINGISVDLNFESEEEIKKYLKEKNLV